MSYYYTNDPNLGNKESEFSYTYFGKELKFKSDLGVFSKERVDFGTNVLINSIPDLSWANSLLDVGCGVGIIGLCMKSKYRQLNIELVDVNTRALKLAAENAKMNDLDEDGKVVIKESNLYENVSESFDLIVSNPPIRAGKDVVHGVVIGGYEHLNKGGKIYIVIQKKQGAPSMESKMNEVFGNVKTIEKKNGYFIFESTKM